MSSVVRALVIGYGTAGTAIIRGLTSAQYKDRIAVSILVRPASLNSTDEKKKSALSALTNQGAKLVSGDLDDNEETLTATLRGFDTIISCVSREQVLKQIGLLKAAVSAGVKHFFPSEFGFDVEKVGRGSALTIYDDKLTVRDAVVQSGIDYTFFQNGAFFELLLSPFAGVNITEATVSARGSIDAIIATTSFADVGPLLAAAVLSPAARNKAIQVSSDVVSYRQIADAIDRVTGKQVELTERSVDELKSAVHKNPADVPARFGVVIGQQQGISWEKNSSWNAINVPEYKTLDLIQVVRNLSAKTSSS